MDLHATKSLPTKIPGFAEEIGRADRVLVVLSDKYLRSPNCMRELLHLFQRSQGDRADLMGRVVMVILGDLKIDRAAGRAVYIRHWRDEHKALESVFQDLGVAAMGAADREEWLAIQDFQHRVSDIMAWVADVLMPRGAEGLDAALERLQPARQHRAQPLPWCQAAAPMAPGVGGTGSHPPSQA